MADADSAPPGGDRSGDTDAPRRTDRGLSREQRVTSSRLFREAYTQNRKFVGPTMVLWLRTGDGASLRLGVVASKKVGNAVRRTRAKRRLREAYRNCRYRMHGDVDVILVARAAIVDSPWKDVEADLLRLSTRAGLVAQE